MLLFGSDLLIAIGETGLFQYEFSINEEIGVTINELSWIVI